MRIRGRREPGNAGNIPDGLASTSGSSVTWLSTFQDLRCGDCRRGDPPPFAGRSSGSGMDWFMLSV
jgi:hypothetical protein